MVERLVIDLYDDREWGVIAASLDRYASIMQAQAEAELEDDPASLSAKHWLLDSKIARELHDNLLAGKYDGTNA